MLHFSETVVSVTVYFHHNSFHSSVYVAVMSLFSCIIFITGIIKMHEITVGHLPAASPDEVDLMVYDNISGRARYHLVKAHGAFICHNITVKGFYMNENYPSRILLFICEFVISNV